MRSRRRRSTSSCWSCRRSRSAAAPGRRCAPSPWWDETRGRMRSQQDGFAYLTILFIVAIMAGGLAVVGQVWQTAAVREREAELLHIGNEYRKAIERYYLTPPEGGGVQPRWQYPKNLTDLIKDPGYGRALRHLRRLYPDPITGNAEWGLVKAPDGGIAGVYSLSEDAPLKTGGFAVHAARLEATASRTLGPYAQLEEGRPQPPFFSRRATVDEPRAVIPISARQKERGGISCALPLPCSSLESRFPHILKMPARASASRSSPKRSTCNACRAPTSPPQTRTPRPRTTRGLACRRPRSRHAPTRRRSRPTRRRARRSHPACRGCKLPARWPTTRTRAGCSGFPRAGTAGSSSACPADCAASSWATTSSATSSCSRATPTPRPTRARSTSISASRRPSIRSPAASLHCPRRHRWRTCISISPSRRIRSSNGSGAPAMSRGSRLRRWRPTRSEAPSAPI